MSVNINYNYSKTYFKQLFETVEKHVIGHYPLEISNGFLDNNTIYDFQGICCSRDWTMNGACTHYNVIISCSCGQSWSQSLILDDEGNIDVMMCDDFCKAINDKYLYQNQTIYKVYTSHFGVQIKNDELIKPLKFDRRISSPCL